MPMLPMGMGMMGMGMMANANQGGGREIANMRSRMMQQSNSPFQQEMLRQATPQQVRQESQPLGNWDMQSERVDGAPSVGQFDWNTAPTPMNAQPEAPSRWNIWQRALASMPQALTGQQLQMISRFNQRQ